MRALRRAGRGFPAALIGLLWGTLVLFPVSAPAQTPSGTVIPNAASADYVAGATGYTVSSGSTAVAVGAAYGVSIAPPGSGVAAPGSAVTYRHTVTNAGNASDRFDLTASSTLGLAVAFFASDNTTPLADSDGNGLPDTGPVPPDGSVDVIVRITIPPGAAPGSRDNTTIRAGSAGDPASSASVSDVTAVPDLWDPLVKTVDPPGQVTPGTVVTYTNTFGNAAGVPATNVAITDVLDARLVYIPGSATLPPGIAGAAVAYDPATRTVTWTLPLVPAGYAGQVRFRATIDPGTPSDTSVSNSISLASDQSPAPQTSNIVTSAVVEQPLRITKKAGRPTAEIGDFVPYVVRVENASALLAVDNVAVVDALPHGFRYVKGSATIDNATAPDPAGGTRPVFALGLMPPGAARTIAYRAVVSVDALLGDGVNAVVAAGVSPAGNALSAGPARVKVLVREGVLNGKAIVLGRVFVDRDADRMPGEGDPGVAGVRIYLEDGTYAVTDREGKYSIDGIAPGEHVLKLDRSTLPPGLTPVPLTNAFAGDGGSRFVSVPFGGPARGDFGLAGEYREVGRAAPAPAAAAGTVFAFDAGGTAPPPVPVEVLVQGMPATPEILEPANGAALARRWTDVVVRVPEGAEHALKVNGLVVPPRKIGKTIHESARKIFVYRYVGIPLEAGPNAVVLEVRDTAAGGMTVRQASVGAPGLPARLVLDPPRATVPAGGKTPVAFTVTLLDRWGKPSPDEAVLTVVAAKGTVAGTDPDPATPGFQVRAQGGSARIDLLPAGQAGADKVRVVLGSALEAEADVYFTPEKREWIVAGVGSARAGDRSVSGDTSRVRDKDEFRDGAYHEERLALFAKGTVLGQYLFTGAYDTGKPKSEGLFERRAGPDKYYPVYGDESVVGYDAESRRKLYLKVERDRSSVLFGDFRTGLTANEFARYDRAFNGLLADIDTGAVVLKAFATETDQVIVKDQIPGNGTSGYFFLSRTPVVANSDKVRIEVRDRYHPEVVVVTTPKTPFVDYTLDPDTGALLFKEPVPSLDPALNPVTIVAVYEAAGGGDAHYTYGGRAGVRLGGRAEAGVTAIVEEKGVANDTLIGADAAVRIAEGLRLKGEFARSETFAAGSGDAWKVELDGEAARGLRYGAYYRDVDAAFSNPSMTGNETGTTKYGAKASYETSRKSSVAVESFVQENHLNGTKLAQHGISGKSRLGRATLEGGYRFLDGTVAAPVPADTTSHLLHAGLSGPIAKNLEGSIKREQVVSSGEVPGYPTRTEAGLAYRVTETLMARLTQEIQESGEKRRATVFGLESRITENTTLSSRYALEDTISGSRAQASIGLNNRWQPRRGLVLSTRAERIQVLGGTTGGPGTALPAEPGTSLAVAAEYLPDNNYKATGRYEIRLGGVETTNLFSLGGAVRIADGLSLLPKMTFWNRDAPQASETLVDGLVGFAWRPKGAPSVYLLDTVRYKVDRSSSAVGSRDTDSLIVSTEATWRVSARWTLLGKYAGKYARESEGGIRSSAYTDLVLAGVGCDLTDRWDVGVQGRLMNQYDAGIHSLGVLARSGYRIYRNLYGGVGYNVSRLDDRDLSGAGYKSHGPFVELRFKFDEETLGLSAARGDSGKQTALPPAPAPAAPVPAPAPPAAPPAPPPARAPDPPAAAATAAVPIAAAPARFAVSGAVVHDPIEVTGSVEGSEIRVQGARILLPEVDVTLAGDALLVRNGRLMEPARFAVSRGTHAPIEEYRLVVRDARGRPIRAIDGKGAPPSEIVWDGVTDDGATVAAGTGYEYRLEATAADGTVLVSRRHLFGVAKAMRVVLAVTARGIGEGSAVLGPEAILVLREAARVARKYPGGTISVAGHTDSAGSEDRNLDLSMRRAEAAASYLAGEGGVPRDRIEVRGYGGRRPSAGNDTPGGRARNRRVEIRGEFFEARRAAAPGLPRAIPAARVNGTALAIDPEGRFAARLPGATERIALDVVSARGSSVRASIPVPRLDMAIPDNLVVTSGAPDAVRIRLRGRTEPGNEVVFRGKTTSADADGTFSLEADLAPGRNSLGVAVRNASGCSRAVRADVAVSPLPAAGGAP